MLVMRWKRTQGHFALPLYHIKPLSNQRGVLTAFPPRLQKIQIAEVRVVQTPATLWKRRAIAYNAMRRRLF